MPPIPTLQVERLHPVKAEKENRQAPVARAEKAVKEAKTRVLVDPIPAEMVPVESEIQVVALEMAVLLEMAVEEMAAEEMAQVAHLQ